MDKQQKEYRQYIVVSVNEGKLYKNNFLKLNVCISKDTVTKCKERQVIY